MTRKQIYAEYGINYNAGKIEYNGTFIPELLKEGNSKTGKRVFTWSMSPGRDGTCVCTCKGCYAMTGFYNMPGVRDALKKNTDIVNNDLEFFYKAVSAQLKAIGSGEVRIHAAGDFKTENSFAYANIWRRIAIENPAFLFWTYTKIEQFENLFDGIENANIVKSVIPGIGFNFGHCDYILDTYRTLKNDGENVFICRCGIDKNQHCENCTHCATSNYVLFIEHSTDYKADKDPMYETLKSVIESQSDEDIDSTIEQRANYEYGYDNRF